MIDGADVVVGLAWGDEAKGKITSYLSSKKFLSGKSHYDFVVRWAGGNNAGHTVYVNGEKFKTHLVPSGIFYGIKSIVGPNCVLHVESFKKELEYLKENGFDTSLVKVAPNRPFASARRPVFINLGDFPLWVPGKGFRVEGSESRISAYPAPHPAP